MKAAEIRSRFLKYFEKHGHSVVESSTLVPQNDPTLLFTNAGMVQFKDVFTGKERRAYTRATTCQKCVRAGGKHNDLENVGFTARHHTFFEMLGNFSFGDYFKTDAIKFAWQFVTGELKISKDKLYVTVHTNDDEAAEIWHKQEGVPRERISRFDADNFWAMGETGPCGPCSEIFVDRGAQFGCGKPDCKVGCSCDRFMEIWNLVFMQFERFADGTMKPLPKPSVDTGAGLERIASVLQNVSTNYDTDIFQEIIRSTEKLSGQKYAGELAVSFRVIADHARATTFLVGDGVLPSNEGRGYVLRRIMRRAIRHGRTLGFTEPFMAKICSFVIDQMVEAYPDLREKRDFIQRAVRAEEEQFLRTLENGLQLLDEESQKLGSKKTLSGDTAFKLYDTFGFPLDLTRIILSERGITVDEAGFEKAMDRQREESRKHWKGSGEEAVDSVWLQVAEGLRAEKKIPVFTGYTSFQETSPCLVSVPGQGNHKDLVYGVFARTPFYGESGGQAGDRGRVHGPDFEAEVIDVKKPVPDLTVATLKVRKGTLKVGQTYTQTTDAHHRALTAKNHTATHLLHWALREVLGKHVKQAGSLVSAELLRFDFAHFQALTSEELTRVENMVNEKIWSGDVVDKAEMSKDAAIAKGAIAFFGEKYGDQVRVVSVGGYSTELCGGTHVDRAGDIHLFKIANESGIAAGIRRIVAYTSKGAFDFLRGQDDLLKRLRDQVLASSVTEIEGKLERMLLAEKDLKKKIEQLQSQTAGAEVDDILKLAKTVGQTLVVASLCKTDPEGIKRLRELSEKVLQKAPNAVVVFGMKDETGQKAMLLSAVGPKASPKAKANAIIQTLAPMVGGRGGGKPDMAQAGGTDVAGLNKAIEHALGVLAPDWA